MERHGLEALAGWPWPWPCRTRGELQRSLRSRVAADFLKNRFKNLGFGLGTSGRDTILVDGCRRSANPLVGLFDRKLQPHNHDDTGFQGDLVRYGMARTREASDTEERGA